MKWSNYQRFVVYCAVSPDDDQSILIEGWVVTSSSFRTNYYSIERFSHGVTTSCLYFTYCVVLIQAQRTFCWHYQFLFWNRQRLKDFDLTVNFLSWLGAFSFISLDPDISARQSWSPCWRRNGHRTSPNPFTTRSMAAIVCVPKRALMDPW